ncbi:hypothetical protein MAR_021632, partial [Mya arenaria]
VLECLQQNHLRRATFCSSIVAHTVLLKKLTGQTTITCLDSNMRENTYGLMPFRQTGVPHICLFASKTIHIGDEIRYDYGDDSGNLFWRNQ